MFESLCNTQQSERQIYNEANSAALRSSEPGLQSVPTDPGRASIGFSSV